MQPDERDKSVLVDFSHATDEEGNALPDDAGMPHLGPAPDGAETGEDEGDAERLAAGADPAAAEQGLDLGSLPGVLPPAD
jgi:hypothetical protein